jgi:pyruvate/2-oxoglutarate dehydrogenase complex dihydrolipoamide dehydrogenase (E3) component
MTTFKKAAKQKTGGNGSQLRAEKIMQAACTAPPSYILTDTNRMMDQRKHSVVVGAGFGGLTFCQNFQSNDARITLIDRTSQRK